MIFRTFTKGLMAGIGFGVGLFVVLAAAVTVGSVKTWKSGETLKADEMNSTIAALKTAIESLAPWTQSGTDATYTSGSCFDASLSRMIPLSGAVHESVISLNNVTQCGANRSYRLAVFYVE